MSFNQWKESTSNKPSSSVLYSPKYGEHREKLRNLENNSKFSMRNPSPSREDFEAFDADRRFREHARQVRQASRNEVRTPNKAESRNNKDYTTPEKHIEPVSDGEDQFYTPLKSNLSSEETFSTPMTSNLGKNLTHFEKLRIRQQLLDEQMNRSFENMSRTFGRVETPEKQIDEENFERASSKLPDVQHPPLPKSPESDRFSLLDSVENSPKTTILPSNPIVDQKTPQKYEVQIEQKMTYVETIICASQMQRKYSEEAEKMEKQLEKLEKIKKSVERLEAGGDKMEIVLKAERIRELNNKLEQIRKVKTMICELDNRKNKEIDSDDEREMENIEILAGIENRREFEKQYSKDFKRYSKELKVLLDVFREKMTAKKERKMRRKMLRSANNSRRNSEAMKIEPLVKKDIATQMTPRIVEEKEEEEEDSNQIQIEKPEVSTPRKAGVEPLDLSSLSKNNTKNGIDDKVAGLNEMLDSIVLNDKSLEDSPFSGAIEIDTTLPNIDESFQNKSDLSFRKFESVFPSRPSSVADETPKSARGSLDLTSARKLSAGIAHFLELHQKSMDESRNSPELEKEVVVEQEQQVIEEEERKSTVEEDKEKDEPWKAPPTSIFDEEEGDETKKFVTKDEYEDDVFEEDDVSAESSTNTVIMDGAKTAKSSSDLSFNDSADDSGFLLNNKPVPKIKSLLDNPSVLQHLADTPRKGIEKDENDDDEDDVTFEETLNETDDERVDIDTCCRDLVSSFGEVMISKAIEKQEELRGCDWCSALDIWQPSTLLQQYKIEDLDDPYEVFDSFWITVWGVIVDLLNEKYLKYSPHKSLSESVARKFEIEAKEILNRDYGPMSKKIEWHKEIRMERKVENLMLYNVDYRFEIRRMMTEHEKQRYRFAQLQMTGICQRYTAKLLDDQLAEIYNAEKENSATAIILNSVDA